MKLTSLCVYCGSSTGTEPVFMEAADRFGRIMADRGVELVYGGGGIGLMGAVARAVLAGGGKVTGIIPKFLTEIEVEFNEVSELVVTDSMHARKQLMFERSQAFVALPGGVGTVEETIEMLTWAQLGRHSRPIVIANIDGFWDPLNELLDHIIKAGFARSEIRRIYSMVDRVEDILPRIEASL
ncbi:TIGR00730 family Rossman fold protein [Parvibaculum sp.]|uniref:LOG family protein n=1 Tax=Parvibaculum sp. TaxID=2024848 RepID=UPI001B0AD9C0|nr:TIGR00730 family Rossman fold protein [Parvibaculum sp.]MBO6635794.1 TIGR00730 family Rossman fold protein [Parvibaculum sp.]MBO6678800.1 TIGR00730 family Rossman fold protein [Parvibaculum sp.]MBO6684848.1 TIGR00730 family Rossman fold protein [Parvibaculum sp.]